MAATLIVLAKLFATALMPTTCSNNFFAAKNTFCDNFAFLSLPKMIFLAVGGAGATVLYNLKKRHPTLDLPVIDYDLALLFQPMSMLGISLDSRRVEDATLDLQAGE
ncbi:sulfite exporter TauE/SafE family protein [Trifolium repens]|nr:sulfite exporter TauE/SafE family protein [Trifolium repens]